MDPTAGRARSGRRVAAVAFAAALLLAVVLAALWLRQRHGGDDSLGRVQRSGLLRIGYAIEAPYAYVVAGGGVTGESPEGAKRIAARLGIARIEWVQTTLDELIPSLRERRFDVIGAGIFISTERQALVRFSQPTLQARLGLLLPRGNPRRLGSCTEALNRSGLRFAVVDGSVEESHVRALGLTPALLLVVPDARSGAVAVAAGSADALALSVPALRWFMAASPGAFEIVADSGAGTAQRVAFAFHPDDAALRLAWNRALAEMLATAEYRSMIARFGFDADDIVELR